MKTVDLRSDTVTLPPPEMRRAIAEAELGDDVF
ncbi:MAG: beta-eliminating lyase-related protein, partial [Dehalococcoidia bacterium]|nr:beta-eliminating lyase-related protein [Dehalococcoidia bacterium]